MISTIKTFKRILANSLSRKQGQNGLRASLQSCCAKYNHTAQYASPHIPTSSVIQHKTKYCKLQETSMIDISSTGLRTLQRTVPQLEHVAHIRDSYHVAGDFLPMPHTTTSQTSFTTGLSLGAHNWCDMNTLPHVRAFKDSPISSRVEHRTWVLPINR